MIVFEGKAFDEKRVVTVTSGESTTWSKGVKDRYFVMITFENGQTMSWNRYLPETVISKVNEIAALINKREEEILKLQYHS